MHSCLLGLCGRACSGPLWEQGAMQEVSLSVDNLVDKLQAHCADDGHPTIWLCVQGSAAPGHEVVCLEGSALGVLGTQAHGYLRQTCWCGCCDAAWEAFICTLVQAFRIYA